MASILHNLNLEEGKSDALREALACLAEASAGDGGPRYADRVIRQLARVVVCRTYARPILELSHLLVAASARDGRYEDLFWGVDRASAGAFRRAFEAVAADTGRVRLSNDTVRHSDAGDAFEVSFSRMPFLAALLEFLITTLGYGEVDELTRPLRDGVASSARVDETRPCFAAAPLCVSERSSATGAATTARAAFFGLRDGGCGQSRRVRSH